MWSHEAFAASLVRSSISTLNDSRNCTALVPRKACLVAALIVGLSGRPVFADIYGEPTTRASRTRAP